MEQGNGSATVPFVVLNEIMARLKELTPDQYIAPEVARESDTCLAAMASEDIKRLYTLRVTLMDESEKIKMRAVQLSREAAKYIETKSPAALDVELKMPNSRLSKLKAGIERVKQKLLLKNMLAKVVDGMFWLEVITQHPDLQGKTSVGIYKDWSLCWREGAEKVPHGIIGIIAVHSVDVSEILGEGGPRGHLH